MWISVSLSVAAVAECRLEPGGPASLFMWSKQCGHCGRDGRGMAATGLVLHQTGLSQVKSSPEATTWTQDCQSTAAAGVCQLCRTKPEGPTFAEVALMGDVYSFLNRIFWVKSEQLKLMCVVYYSGKILLSFLNRYKGHRLRHSHHKSTHTLFWALIKALKHLTWWWNVMLVSDIHLPRGTHRCWNK